MDSASGLMLLAKYFREAAWLKHEQRTRHRKQQLWNKGSPLNLYESQCSHLWNGGCNPCPTFLPKEGTQEVIQGKSPHQISVATLVMLNKTLKTTVAYSSKHWIRSGVCGVQLIRAWLLPICLLAHVTVVSCRSQLNGSADMNVLGSFILLGIG